MIQKANELEVLTLEEVADLLRVSREDVERLIADRRLPAQNIYGQWRILRTIVFQWLADQQPPGGLLAFAGAFRDDPDLEEMTAQVFRERGRPIVEE